MHAPSHMGWFLAVLDALFMLRQRESANLPSLVEKRREMETSLMWTSTSWVRESMAQGANERESARLALGFRWDFGCTSKAYSLLAVVRKLWSLGCALTAHAHARGTITRSCVPDFVAWNVESVLACLLMWSCLPLKCDSLASVLTNCVLDLPFRCVSQYELSPVGSQHNKACKEKKLDVWPVCYTSPTYRFLFMVLLFFARD